MLASCPKTCRKRHNNEQQESHRKPVNRNTHNIIQAGSLAGLRTGSGQARFSQKGHKIQYISAFCFIVRTCCHILSCIAAFRGILPQVAKFCNILHTFPVMRDLPSLRQTRTPLRVGTIPATNQNTCEGGHGRIDHQPPEMLQKRGVSGLAESPATFGGCSTL